MKWYLYERGEIYFLGYKFPADNSLYISRFFRYYNESKWKNTWSEHRPRLHSADQVDILKELTEDDIVLEML